MAFNSILDLWNKWNTRGFVILSLSLQVFLILFASLRKKTVNRPIVFLLWLAYLMADWVAAFAIGLITHNQRNLSTRATEVDGALQAFWVSFLLLHLGGQDTIIAFSMEDSWLWRRHLLTLIFQVRAAIYVFVQLLSSDKSLVILTMLVFLAAIIKNVERTVALYLSSLPKLRESMLTQHKYFHYAENRLAEELNSLRGGHCEEEEEKLDESTVVMHAYCFFQIFRVFIADFMFAFRQRTISRNYFLKISAERALRVISVELNFMYEALHTKALAIRFKRSYVFHQIAFLSVFVAFLLFNHFKKHQLSKLDVKTTYILLFGGIALDVIALLMLVFSDWTVAGIMCYNQASFLHKLLSGPEGPFLHKLLSATDNLRKPQFATCEAEPNANVTYAVLNTPIIFRRWSELISACNLLLESLKECPRKMYKRDWHQGILTFSNICNFPCRMIDKFISCFHRAGDTIARGCLRNTEGKIPMIGNMKYVSKNPFFKNLRIFIFKEVGRKSVNAEYTAE